MTRTTVIAEPGCTAEGRYEAMLQLIRVASQAGCDVFKAQWTSDAAQMCARRNAPDYERFYRWLAFPVEWHADFRELCQQLGLQYACSVYLHQDCAIVAPYVSFLKISSFECKSADLSRAASATGRSVVVSVGAAQEWDIWGVTGGRYLHCVSAYPAPLDELNLSVMGGIGRYDGAVWSGFSDHSRDLDVGAFAVCAGAEIIETHFRLFDCDRNNPDFATAFDPAELAMYVAKIRKAERCMGSGYKQIQPSEQWALRYKVTA